MWKLSSAKNDPLVSSYNGCLGRYVWTFDPEAGTPEERAAVDEARDRFTANRNLLKDNNDVLMRLQLAKNRRSGPFSVDPATSAAASVTAALRNGISYFEALQQDDGCWVGDFGGPLFQLPPLLIALHTTGVLDTVLSSEHKKEMIRYLRNHQNEDGGWGRHIHAPSGMLGTALNYVALRILGVGPTDDGIESARAWIHARGGATSIPPMAKFWVAVLGVYDWAGLNPTPPETLLGLYAAWTGVGLFHPGRYHHHARLVYCAMAYTQCRRCTAPHTPLTDALRQELYPVPYESIDWKACRNLCAEEDALLPRSPAMEALLWAAARAERYVPSRLRELALAECMRQVHYEDEVTHYLCSGPIVKAHTLLACWAEDPGGEAFRRHLPRVTDYLWVAEDGMTAQTYLCYLWETAFAAQAVAASGLAGEFPEIMTAMGRYLEGNQMLAEAPGPLERYYRHPVKGGWTTSHRDAHWIVSDTSSEGLKAALVLKGLDLPVERLFDCVGAILSFQNSDGGFAAFERARGPAFLEFLNPSRMFAEIMVEHSHVECTASCITALTAFARAHPEHRSKDIAESISRAIKFVKGIQRPDGSWYGYWGVCFIYGTRFGLEALAAVGEGAENSEKARKACEFLLSKQRKDGGWAESHLSCDRHEYVELELEGGASHGVSTAWALQGLIAAGWHTMDRKPLDAAAQCLIALQQPNGDWPAQRIVGAMSQTLVHNYANYRTIFPIWALAQYRTQVVRQ